MDSPSTAAVSNATTINAFTAPANGKLTNLTISDPSWPRSKPKFPDFCVSNARFSAYLRNKKSELFSVHCSTTPNTDRENTTDENLTVSSGSNSRIHGQPTSGTNQAISPLSSSFSRGLVLNLGFKGSWDSVEIGSPVVKRYLSDEEERWYMWYHGCSSGNPLVDSIGLAISSNGIHWKRGGGAVNSSADVGLVMNCSTDWWAFDTQGIRPSEVVIMSSAKVRVNNSLYWLYYTGFNASEKIELSNDELKFNLQNPERLCIGDRDNHENKGFDMIYKSLPGLAISQDGRHWARIEGEHPTGALFDVGSEGEWDSFYIASPQVVFHGAGDLRMYYHSFDVEKGHFAVGIARSRDGIKWVKLGKIIGEGTNGSFDEHGVMNARVMRDRKDGKYVMAYEGVAADGGKSIGLAFSSDGLKNWRRFQDGPVLNKSEEDGWDCAGVGSPCLIQMDGDSEEWRLYYGGIGKDGRTGIGLAVSEGSEISKFQRWTGFQF